MKKYIMAAMLAATVGMAGAHDFVVTQNGQKLYFDIKSQKNKTVEVTYNGNGGMVKPAYYEGELEIPAKVKHGNVVYTVVSISAKAFSGSDMLTGVTLPAGVVTIGDFAFEGCTSLNRIVFPGKGVKFGQGVFFKCDKIANVSLGSDWTEVDLKMFRWSDSLSNISIPAKVTKIQNMKSLKNLKTIEVDINNGRFQSINGVLYNKSGEILYGCPRAYEGKLKVVGGTKRITKGALVDCLNLTQVDLPETLEAISFREFSRLKHLNEILFRAKEPLKTAKKDGKEVFLLQVAAPDVKIIVVKNSKNSYKKALVQQEGEYTELDGNMPFTVAADELPSNKNVKGVKTFSKYE